MEMKIEPLALPGVDTQRPIVIAGPCSAETEEQVLETAQGLASRGVKIFRAGYLEASYETGWIRGHRSRGIGLVEESEKRDRHAGIYRGSD